MIMFFADVWIVYHIDYTIPIYHLDHMLESHNILLGGEFGIDFFLFHSS